MKKNLAKTFVAISSGLCLLLFGLSGLVHADSNSVNFESPAYSTGVIHGQDGWNALGSAGSGCATYDEGVVANSFGYSSFGSQAFRISDAVTSGCFGDQAFAKSLTNAVGEVDSTASSYSIGTLQRHFEMQFDIASTVPGAQQSGLHISVSPDRGDGSRMSYLRFEDGASGIGVYFDDVQGTSNPANFVEAQIASGLNRAVPHTVKLTFDALDGPSNDVVKVWIDGNLVKTGTSWENYYRYDSESSAEQSPRIVKTVLFRAGGSANIANSGNGFLIDSLALSSSAIPATSLPNNTFVYSTVNGLHSVNSDGTGDNLLVSSSVVPGPHNPMITSNREKIYFQSSSNGMYSVNFDGSNLTNFNYLVPNAPALSPDSTKIAYKIGGVWFGGAGIAIRNVDGTGAISTIHQSVVGEPNDITWATNNKLVYFFEKVNSNAPVGADDCYNFLVSLNTNGTGLTYLTPDNTGNSPNTCATPRHPDVVPATGLIVYTLVNPHVGLNGSQILYTVNLDGSNNQLLYTPPSRTDSNGTTYGSVGFPHWSPDGNYIETEYYDPNSTGNVGIVNASNGALSSTLNISLNTINW